MTASVLSKAANHSLARTLAAVVGAPLVAFTWGAGSVAFLPLSAERAFAFGFHLVVPLWVALACVLPLLKNGRVAWGVCLALALPLAVALVARRAG